VASRWRIRHKLMLGLGLVVATMALLLGGTVFGLCSYYLDMVSLRVKTMQLKLAEEFKSAVSDLTRLDETSRLARRTEPPRPEIEVPEVPGLPPLPGDGTEAPRKRPRATTLPEAIKVANKLLDDFEADLQESSGHAPDSTNAEQTAALIGKMREAFHTMSLNEQKPPKEIEAGMFPEKGDGEVNNKEDRERKTRMREIELDADDLCDLILGGMHKRIDKSRRNYQVTAWIAGLASGVGLLLVCGVFGSFYAWVFHPIRDLEAGVARVAKGDFDHRIEVHSGDEMEDLATAFNNMMQRLHDLYSDLARQVNERSRQLVRSERLASVGFLAAGVAHEINNPLASIAFCSEALEARLNDLLHGNAATERRHYPNEEQEVFSKYLKMIQEEAFRCKNITERLLAFSRPGERRREKTDLRDLVQMVLDVTQHLPNHRGKEISFEMSADRLAGGAPLAAWVNSEEIKSVVLNLVVNALDSMEEGGRLTIRLNQRADMAELQFTDDGCGMNQEVLENIFEPFYTRSRTGKGTGLGLTITHRIITQHGGEIEATSPGPNQGSTFIVRLPINAPEESSVLSGPGADLVKGDEQAAPRMPQVRAA
jgi:two-component system, NtrC family, sensor kinase